MRCRLGRDSTDRKHPSQTAIANSHRKHRSRPEESILSSYVLIPGAGGAATWYWHRVVPLLEQAGQAAIPVDLPGPDQQAGLPEYARLVADAITASGAGPDVVLVAQSMGGFTVPLVPALVPVRAIVLVNAMIPRPGETAGAWWENTGVTPARIAAARAGGYPVEFDEQEYFLHDLTPEVVATGASHKHNEAEAAFATPCDFAAWPAVPTRVVAGADDRFFPAGFQRAVARDRLGIEADVLPGGHLMALSRPAPLAGYLLEVTAAGR
jgi:alpha-beta hydrolase superfamily lysophospholipase